MTRCDLPDTDLIAYTDGELHGARREYVEVHLRVCTTCQARLEEIHETTRLLQRATPLTDDPDGRARIKARLAVEAQRTPRHSLRLPMLVAAPALVLIILVVVSITWTTSPTEAAVSLRSLKSFIAPIQTRDSRSKHGAQRRSPTWDIVPGAVEHEY